MNSSGKAVSGTLVLGLDADPEKKVEIALSQAAVDEEEGGECWESSSILSSIARPLLKGVR